MIMMIKNRGFKRFKEILLYNNSMKLPEEIVNKIMLFTSHPVADLLRPFFEEYQEFIDDSEDEYNTKYLVYLFRQDLRKKRKRLIYQQNGERFCQECKKERKNVCTCCSYCDRCNGHYQYMPGCMWCYGCQGPFSKCEKECIMSIFAK
jgi:hypothetical protein